MKFAYPSGARPLEGYTIKRGIGVGGFGEVYFALSDAGKEVALKRIQRNLDVELRGVRQCLNLKHINLISLWDIKTNDAGESWVVMEYVPGHSLRDVVEDHPNGMPEEQVKDWFVSTSAGVAYLHDHGIVHRDLKPGNVFYDADQQVIKIGDYGLSKFISCSRRSGQTESVGTFHYMAPEIGKGVYGKEIDIYALGIMFYEMLTGRVPFEGESSQEIIMKHLTANPNLDHIPGPFQPVIQKCLIKDPERRYSNIPEMLGELPWPEIAAKGREVLKRNSIGPIGLNQNPNEQQVAPAQVSKNSRRSTVVEYDQKMELRSAEVDVQPSERRAKPKVAPGSILFGDVRENGIQLGNVRVSQAGTSANRPDAAPSAPTSQPGNTGRNDTPHSVTAARSLPEEPIARAVQSGAMGLSEWWNNTNISVPLKVAILIAAIIVVVSNSSWLLPVSLGLGLVYLIYFAVRDWMLSDSDNKEATLAPTNAHAPESPTTKTQTKKEKLAVVREWLGFREVSDRAVELLGSLIIATIASAVFNLLGVAISGSIFDASIDNWAEFTWKTMTCVAASWTILITSKFWEPRQGNGWLRRAITATLGIGVGFVAYYGSTTLHVDVESLTRATSNPNFPSALQLTGISQLAGFILFFVTLFFILRWWKQSDPARKTRLSIWSVGACLAWAGLLSHMLDLVPLTACVMAVVTSISVQLAAPWLHPQDRERIAASQSREQFGQAV